MNQRPALYAVAERYGLDAAATDRLLQLAGLDDEPPGVSRWLPRGLAALAATLVGLGLIMWVAANWDALGRIGQFALLQGLVLTACLGAFALPGIRSALALLALLAIGGLLAYFGQTYQTGADPWQLFAWWGLLAVPLALAVRADVLWTPWALVAVTAIALWAQAHARLSWSVSPDDLAVYAVSWGSAALVVGWLSPALRHLTGAGIWALRTAATLAVSLVTLAAIGGLFSSDAGIQYWLGLAMLAGAALILTLPRTFEIGTLSAVVLGLDTLLVAGLSRWLLDDFLREQQLIGILLLLGLTAAALVAGSVTALLRLARLRAGGKP